MGKLKGLLILLILFGGIYVGWMLVPPYFHNWQFQDDLDDIARTNSYMRRTDDDVRATVIKKADEIGISLKEDQIIITRLSDGLGISVKYHVHIDLILHPMDLDFTANSMNRRNI
ncbi:MAG TPA: hypothetical protein VHA33_23535 [Candidatus Angelobacter sp.]|jgi:hypothetical protein|nr:hypothetical protein [Candidatus Angelobacter sp.]